MRAHVTSVPIPCGEAGVLVYPADGAPSANWADNCLDFTDVIQYMNTGGNKTSIEIHETDSNIYTRHEHDRQLQA
jgi:hypothetical protein